MNKMFSKFLTKYNIAIIIIILISIIINGYYKTNHFCYNWISD